MTISMELIAQIIGGFISIILIVMTTILSKIWTEISGLRKVRFDDKRHIDSVDSRMSHLEIRVDDIETTLAEMSRAVQENKQLRLILEEYKRQGYIAGPGLHATGAKSPPPKTA